ncbi:unnamed protein product [Calypogeia fissa]
MGENFKEFSILLTELARIEVNLEATNRVDLVLWALPISWHAFGSMIAARENLPSLTELEQLIMTKETRRLAIEEPNGEALAAHQAMSPRFGACQPAGQYTGPRHARQGRATGPGRGRGRVYSPRVPPYVPPHAHGVCHTCGSSGHYQRECELYQVEAQMRELEIQKNELKKKVKVKLQAHFAKEGVVADDKFENAQAEGVLACLTELEKGQDSGWYLDYGASTHFTTEKDSLTDYVPSSSSKVTTAGGGALDVKGKGIVTFDENKA